MNCRCFKFLNLLAFFTSKFYRPPTSSVGNVRSLNNCLLSVPQFPIILFGDFNVPNIDWHLVSPAVSTPVANCMCKLIRDNYFHQLVADSTRKDYVLVLIFTNRPEIVADVEVVDNLPSTDHDAIYFDLNILLPPQGPCTRTLYNYKKADLLLLSETLSRIPWGLIEQCDTIEDAWVFFKDLFFGAVDIAVPRQKW